MTVESNYVIAIATLSDLLKSRISFSKPIAPYVRVIFPALTYNC